MTTGRSRPSTAPPSDPVPTILIAEDDFQVLKVVERILRDASYTTITARDGREAWNTFQKAAEPFDLVIADVIMPHMTGTELAARIAGRHPDLPLILMSGYAPQELASRGLVLSHGHLLTKPFMHEDLLDLVRRLLPA